MKVSQQLLIFPLFCRNVLQTSVSFLNDWSLITTILTGQGNTPVGMWHWNELGSINLDPKQDLGRKLYFFFQCLLRADLNGSIWSHFTWRGIFQKCVNEKRKMCTVSCSVWVTVQITVYLRVKYLTIALVFFLKKKHNNSKNSWKMYTFPLFIQHFLLSSETYLKLQSFIQLLHLKRLLKCVQTSFLHGNYRH